MAVQRYHITSTLAKKTSINDVADDFRRHTNRYYNLSGESKGISTFTEQGLTATTLPPTEIYEDQGGCFHVNDIGKVYRIIIKSDYVRPYDDKDSKGRTLDDFTKVVYGSGPDQSISPLASTDAGLIPYQSDGLLTKGMFDTRFYDFSFSHYIPFNENGRDEFKDPDIPTWNMTSKYNFFNSEYEAATTPANSQESSFPNIYDMLDEIQYGTPNSLPSLVLWDDPKCQIFQGGVSTYVMKSQPAPQNTVDAFIHGELVNFASSIVNPFFHIALFEKRLYGKELDSMDTEYEGQLLKNASQITREYFLRWANEYMSPSIPSSNSKPTDFGLEEIEKIRSVLSGKYKNILFRGTELMDFTMSKVDDSFSFASLYPMHINLTLNRPEDNFATGVKLMKAMLIDSNLYQAVMEKFADTTALSPDFMKLQPGNAGTYNDYYDPEILYPRVLDGEDSFYDNRTLFSFKRKEHNNSISIESTKYIKTIDWLEFVGELISIENDYAADSPDGIYTRQFRHGLIGINPLHGSLYLSPNVDEDSEKYDQQAKDAAAAENNAKEQNKSIVSDEAEIADGAGAGGNGAANKQQDDNQDPNRQGQKPKRGKEDHSRSAPGGDGRYRQQ